MNNRAGKAHSEAVPSGTARRLELEAGEQIVISTPNGALGSDFSFVGFDQAVTRNVNGWNRYGKPWLVFAADPGMVLGDGGPVLEFGPARGDSETF